MKRDMGVTVTRDNTVTSQVRRHVTSGVTKRVSHATTTTPHHTMYLVTQVCGVSGKSIHPSLQAVGGHRTNAMDGRYAQIRRWF